MGILRTFLIAGALALQVIAGVHVAGNLLTAAADDLSPGMEATVPDAQMEAGGTHGANLRRARIASAPTGNTGGTDTGEATVHIIKKPAVSGPERGYNRQAATETYRTAWRAGNDHEYVAIAGDWHVRYTALFDTAGISVTTTRNTVGIKQSLILKNGDAPAVISWGVETNAAVQEEAGGLVFSGGVGETVFTVPPPLAWDADGNPVAASGKYDPGMMIYGITVDTAGVDAWPVTLDPTTIVQSLADGGVYAYDCPEYEPTRALNGGSLSNLLCVGQSDNGYHDGYRHYSVYRSFLSFPVPEMIDALACTLYVDGWDDNSEVDFDVWLVGAEAYGPALDSGDFRRFHGRQTAGPHTSTKLNYTWNSASWNAGWNAMIFRSAGLDSLFAASGDTLRIALISYEDISNSPPASDISSNEEFIRFESSGQSHPPYISISYIAPEPPETPSYIGITGAGADYLDAVATTADAYTDSIFWYIDDACDGATVYPDTTYRFEGLPPAASFEIQAAAGNQYGVSDRTDPVEATTIPRTPGIALIDPLAPSALRFVIDPLDNPAEVEFAIQDSITGKYLDGDATPDTLRSGPPESWGWRSFSDWGAASGDTLGGLHPDSLYVLRVKAR